MLQRIQTVFLGLVALIYGILMFIPILAWTKENGDPLTLSVKSQPLLAVGYGIVILFSLFIISTYKKRKQQMILVVIMEILIIIMIILDVWAICTNTIARGYEFLPGKSFGIYLELIAVILCFLSYRRIRKDEELVKSIDRIR